jgi:hypothetical protein
MIWGNEKKLELLIILGVAATCLSLWLCRNDIIFMSKHNTFLLRVIYSIIHFSRTWAILEKLASHDLVVAISLCLAQMVIELITLAHRWRSSLWIDWHKGEEREGDGIEGLAAPEWPSAWSGEGEGDDGW